MTNITNKTSHVKGLLRTIAYPAVSIYYKLKTTTTAEYDAAMERLYGSQRRHYRNRALAAIGGLALITKLFGTPATESPQTPGGLEPTEVVQTEPEKSKITIYYHVKFGDALNKISSATGVLISDIEKQNPNIFKKGDIWPGDILEIDVTPSKLYDAINGQADDGLNGAFYSTYEAAKHESNILYYTVGKGDFLQDIADAFGVDIDDLIQENNIQNEDYIQAGAVLKITNPIPKTDISNVLTSYGLRGIISFTANNQSTNINQTETLTQETNDRVEAPEGTVKIIDVSNRCGDINWDKLIEAYYRGEYSGIILRMAETWDKNYINPDGSKGTYKFTVDAQFEEGLAALREHDIDIGVYFFQRAWNLELAERWGKEAANYLKSLKDADAIANLNLGVWIDILEDDMNMQMKVFNSGNHEEIVSITETTAEEFDDAGFEKVGYYCNKNGNQIIRAKNYESTLGKRPAWIARYLQQNPPKKPVTQLGGSFTVELDQNIVGNQVYVNGKVDGVPETVDVNLFDISFIKAKEYKPNLEPTLHTPVNYGFKMQCSENESKIGETTLNCALNNPKYQEKLIQDGFCLVEETGMEVSCHVDENGKAIYWVGEAIESPKHYHARLAKGNGRYLAPPTRNGGVRI